MLDSDCCAAIPMITLVSTPPRSSWPIGTSNSASVMASVANPPISSREYLTTAACAVPIRGSSTLRAARDSPNVAMLANTKNATADAAAMIWYWTWPERK
jgi:hypothetical protein